MRSADSHHDALPSPNASLDAVWQASPLAIVTIDGAYSITSSNPAGMRLLRGSRREVVGSRLPDFVHSMDAGAALQMLDAAAKGEIPARQEIRFERIDGSEVVGGFSVAPLDPDRPGPSVCVIRDLSSEQALRPNLLHAERMASIGVIASTVAHELNNPLAAATGCIELIEQGADGETAELARIARSEIERAARIVEDLNVYARRSEGTFEAIEPAALIERMCRIRRYGPRRLELEIETEPDLPKILGNPNQLLQALVNLVRNAEQAIEEAGHSEAPITLRASRRGDTVRLSVVDRGPGIAPEALPRLFEPFYSTKALGEGTGLGLTVVQAVAHGHGGRVAVDDTPGGGATFHLFLPYAPETESPDAHEGEPSETPDLPPGTRILVADDEPVLRMLVSRISPDLEVTEAADAHDAIAALDYARGAFDAVILDVRMPGGGGAAVYRHLESEYPDLIPRTIFMTGAVDTNMRELVGSGYVTTLAKPFRLRRLVTTLLELL